MKRRITIGTGCAVVVGIAAYLIYAKFITTPPSAPLTASPTVPAGQQGPKHGAVITNSIGMKLVYVKEGEFEMGSAVDIYPFETISHRVKLTRGFYVGTYEVTQEQWQAVMETSVAQQRDKADLWIMDQLSNSSRVKEEFGSASEMMEKFRSDGKSTTSQMQGEGDAYPMYLVSWEEATEFCRKLSEKEQRLYRLPTEAEWEYACRAGTTTSYSWGYDWRDGVCNAATKPGDNNVSIFRDRGLPVQSTIPVGSFQPNAWGLHDMHGNVSEWCSDRYAEYPLGMVTDPVGATSGAGRVARGGSWMDGPDYCTSTIRNSLTLTLIYPMLLMAGVDVNSFTEMRNPWVGFRVALSSGAAPK